MVMDQLAVATSLVIPQLELSSSRPPLSDHYFLTNLQSRPAPTRKIIYFKLTHYPGKRTRRSLS